MKNNIACSMITGEELIDVDGANHTSSTIEMFDASKRYDVAVIDEGQMVGDKDRGGYWAAAILGVYAPEVHICTAPEGVTLIKRLIAMCRDEVEEVAHKRTVPLVAQSETFRYPSDGIRDGSSGFVQKAVAETGCNAGAAYRDVLLFVLAVQCAHDAVWLRPCAAFGGIVLRLCIGESETGWVCLCFFAFIWRVQAVCGV